jgi:hypothetical protein
MLYLFIAAYFLATILTLYIIIVAFNDYLLIRFSKKIDNIPIVKDDDKIVL